MISALGHVNFMVKDMEASMHFYCDILGLKKAFDIHKEDGSLAVRYLKITDGQFIELMPPGPHMKANQQAAEGNKQGTSFRHICLEVEDINALIALLQQHEIKIVSQLKQGRDLNYQVFAADPDGNRIEFMQMHPDSPQRNS